ncbi:MAG: YjbQ family protein [Planctomycetaceae bacterium]|nr:secondary thiamine-phosphate synthase enzyme YjbQ [Planctomycetota bacterium]NUN53927.1 YjbQ family protein [Planctomycetaceae bacterium]
MKVHHARIAVRTRGRGFTEVTGEVAAAVAASGVRDGLAVLFSTHTSCSLCIQENADPSARRDMERFLEDLAPEGDPRWTHTAEGPEDSPSHLRSLVTRTSETVPVVAGALALGTWQGIFLCEHRARPRERTLLLTVTGV